MLIFIILQFILSIAVAIFISKKVFEYDVSITKRNKIILTSTALFLLIFAAISSEITPRVAKYFFMKDIEKAMLNNPMFIGIKDYDEDMYQTILSEASKSFDKGTVKKDMTDNMQLITAGLFFAKLPNADDDTIIEYTELTIQKVKILQSRPNNLCFELLFPSAYDTFDNNTFDQDLINKEVQIFLKLLKSPDHNTPLSDAALSLLITPIYQRLSETYEDELVSLENPNTPNLNKAKTCAMVVELYTEILKLHPQEAGAVLRTMFALD